MQHAMLLLFVWDFLVLFLLHLWALCNICAFSMSVGVLSAPVHVDHGY
jgi:hypothetical protein